MLSLAHHPPRTWVRSESPIWVGLGWFVWVSELPSGRAFEVGLPTASELQQKVRFAAPQFGGEHGPRAGGGVAGAPHDSTTAGSKLQQQHASTRDQSPTHTHHQLLGAAAPTTAVVPEQAAQHQASVSAAERNTQQNTGRPTQHQALPHNFFRTTTASINSRTTASRTGRTATISTSVRQERTSTRSSSDSGKSTSAGTASDRSATATGSPSTATGAGTARADAP